MSVALRVSERLCVCVSVHAHEKLAVTHNAVWCFPLAFHVIGKGRPIASRTEHGQAAVHLDGCRLGWGLGVFFLVALGRLWPPDCPRPQVHPEIYNLDPIPILVELVELFTQVVTIDSIFLGNQSSHPKSKNMAKGQTAWNRVGWSKGLTSAPGP